MRYILFIAFLFFCFPAFASGIKSDEEVIFFPTAAHQSGDQWVVPVHAWVFEPEDGSLLRKGALAALAHELDLDDDAAGSVLFKERAKWFLVDNQRGKHFRLTLFDKEIGDSGANGHILDSITIPQQLSVGGGSVSYTAQLPAGDKREFRGEAFLLPETGVSVISDIDDTIKISEVLDKKKLMENTFLKPYAAAPGMVEAYKRLAAANIAFHYLSSSPWQLYPALSSFMDEAGFPKGSFDMRDFRLKDETIFNVLKSSEETKPPGIRKLFDDFPKRQFILIGDSGEKDPEIYGRIAREYPGRVKHIYIRKVTEDAADAARYKTAFEGVDAPFTLFEDAAAIMP